MVGKSKVTRKKQHGNGGIMNQMVSQDQMQQWATPDVSTDDLVIPKILAMQGLSDAVTNGNAKFGEFRDSLNNKLVGSIDKPFEFIPVYCQKLWLVFDATSKKKEFLRTEQLTELNKDHPFQYENLQTKKKEEWQRVYSFYVLLPEEVKAGHAMPYIINFKGTSFQAGKILFTQCFVINPRAGKSPASQVMLLGGTKQSNDMGTFVVMNTKLTRAASKGEEAEAQRWNQILATIKVKVDDRDLKKTETDAEKVPF